MEAEKIIKELEANYGYKFERDYFIKFREYKQLIDDVVKVISLSKTSVITKDKLDILDKEVDEILESTPPIQEERK